MQELIDSRFVFIAVLREEYPLCLCFYCARRDWTIFHVQECFFELFYFLLHFLELRLDWVLLLVGIRRTFLMGRLLNIVELIVHLVQNLLHLFMKSINML
jgi:hypothetical protein